MNDRFSYPAARAAAWLRRRGPAHPVLPAVPSEPGISVVIPSRNGKDLLAALLPGLARELPPAGEVLVVDNGSGDGTAEWLHSSWPHVKTKVFAEPLSFARAVNRGIEEARYSHVCLLNNDMLVDPGFFPALERAFEQVPDLFCATAQIRFPPGVRREETGKAVMRAAGPDDFPIRCDEPLAGEDLTYVLYGSGGCSLYDAARLRALGGLDAVYEPAYVEDLDVGYRAWLRGWPSVYVAGAGVEHRHRATTSRYYTGEQLEAILERNYLRFLARCIWSPELFRQLWAQAVARLRLRAPQRPAARQALAAAARIALAGRTEAPPVIEEELVLALANGSVWVFPGRASQSTPQVLVACEDIRGARAPTAAEAVIVTFSDTGIPPSPVLETCREMVLVRRGEPRSFRAALRQTIRKWRPEMVRLQGPLSPFAADCAPARVILFD